MPVRIVMADDHPLIMDAMGYLFRAPDFEVLAKCEDGEKALEKVRKMAPDIAILDIRMPGIDGIEVARTLKEENIPTRVILLTAELDDGHLLNALRAGVQGIVLKEMAPRFIVPCVRTVHGGGMWFESIPPCQAVENVFASQDTGIYRKK